MCLSTSIRLARSVLVSLLLLFVVAITVSCAQKPSRIEVIAREISLCSSLSHKNGKPLNDPELHKLSMDIAGRHAPSGGIVLCSILERALPEALSLTVIDRDGKETIVIWFEARLLRESDLGTRRAVIGHEIGHQFPKGGCSETDRTHYIYCEHMIDRIGARLVGLEDTVHGLANVAKMMAARGARKEDIALVKERIALLKKHAFD